MIKLIPLDLFNNIYDDLIYFRNIGNPDDFNYELQSIIVKDTDLETAFTTYKAWLDNYKKITAPRIEKPIHYYGFAFSLLTKDFYTMDGIYDFKPKVETVGFIPTFLYWFKDKESRDKQLKVFKENIKNKG